MKVRSLVADLAVDEGQIYEVCPCDEVYMSAGVAVFDKAGDIYFLLDGEYEIVEE